MIQNVAEEVRRLMSADKSGHGFEHVERVWRLTRLLAEKENADCKVAELAALLHDCDDYKLVGVEKAEELSNAKQIMKNSHVPSAMQEKVLNIIRSMGYSKSLKGIRPTSLEGKIVSDADMLDAIGACGIVRCMQFALERCNQYNAPIFEKNVWPERNLSAEEYKMPNRRSDNFVNHFFEKLLKLKNMMMTDSGKKEAQKRHQIMVDFLDNFFAEQGLDDWQRFLHDYLDE